MRIVTTAGDKTRDETEEAVEVVATTPQAPATRRKLSGAELESRFEDWREQRRESRTPEEDARRLRRGLCALMGTGILTLTVANGVMGQSFEAAQSRKAERIAQLSTQVADARAVEVDAGLAERMVRLSEAAATDGRAVAAAQQGFADLHHQASTQPGPGNGVPNRATVQIAEHRRVLAPLFDEDSYLVDDEEAYFWTSTSPFDPSSEIDPRFDWYVRYDGTEASSPDTYAWTVETVMPDLDGQDASGATNTAQVIWVCRDTQTAQVLAWAKANYAFDGDDGVFDDLEVVVTLAGAQHQQEAGQEQVPPKAPQIGKPGAGRKDNGRKGNTRGEGG